MLVPSFDVGMPGVRSAYSCHVPGGCLGTVHVSGADANAENRRVRIDVG